MEFKTQYIPEDSLFITKDHRKNRWAIPYHFEAVNTRAHILLGNNINHIKGKLILDLGCHFGTFSYISLKLGGRFVKGVDYSTELIEQAKEMFASNNAADHAYNFVSKDVIQFLENSTEDSFDTVLCFGLLYYIPDNYYFLKLLKKVARKAIIIDTFTAYYSVVQGKDALKAHPIMMEDAFKLPIMMHTLTQTNKKYYNLPDGFGNKPKKLSFVTCPTISLLELFFSSLELKSCRLDWSSCLKNPGRKWQDMYSSQGKSESHWTDVYSANIRVSYLLTL